MGCSHCGAEEQEQPRNRRHQKNINDTDVIVLSDIELLEGRGGL